jgi:hypothetical protein
MEDQDMRIGFTKNDKRSANQTIKTRLFVVTILIWGFFFSTHVNAGPQKAPEKIDAVMIGDRVVDIAYNLGFVPSAMSVRCSLWPMCDSLKKASQVLGCPRCIVTKNPKVLPNYLRKNNIQKVIIEKSEKFCLYMPDVNPMKAVPLLDNLNPEIQYVDFSRGIDSAILQTSEILGVKEKGPDLVQKYKKKCEQMKTLIPAKGLSRRVLILNGVYQAATGKTFIRVEAPGGYSDKYVLEPLGCVNVGGILMKEGTKVFKGHFNIRKLNTITKANPDVIIMTGEAYAVQKALSLDVRSNPEMANIPALHKAALFALPLYVDSSVLEYPGIFRKWASVLAM